MLSNYAKPCSYEHSKQETPKQKKKKKVVILKGSSPHVSTKLSMFPKASEISLNSQIGFWS